MDDDGDDMLDGERGRERVNIEDVIDHWSSQHTFTDR